MKSMTRNPATRGLSDEEAMLWRQRYGVWPHDVTQQPGRMDAIMVKWQKWLNERTGVGQLSTPQSVDNTLIDGNLVI